MSPPILKASALAEVTALHSQYPGAGKDKPSTNHLYTTEYGKVKKPKNVTEKSKKSTHFEKAVIVVL